LQTGLCKTFVNAGLIGAQRSATLQHRYALSPKARSLSHLLRELYRWGHNNAEDFKVEIGPPLIRTLDHQGP